MFRFRPLHPLPTGLTRPAFPLGAAALAPARGLKQSCPFGRLPELLESLRGSLRGSRRLLLDAGSVVHGADKSLPV